MSSEYDRSEVKGNWVFLRKTYVLNWLDRVSRWLLAAIFLYAGVPKIADPQFFSTVIGAYGLLPEYLLLPAGVLLPLAEIVTALLLLYGRVEGLWLSVFLMLLFLFVLGYGMYLGLDIDCGCFGPEDPEHAAFSGLRSSFIRDLLLCIPLTYSLYFHFSTSTNTHITTTPFGEK